MGVGYGKVVVTSGSGEGVDMVTLLHSFYLRNIVELEVVEPLHRLISKLCFGALM